MKMQAVQSSNVEAVGYDEATRTMHVQFKGGATYSHHGVTPEAHRSFVTAGSLGSHYHVHFKNKFGVRKVEK